jgi:hypothetical protein
MYKLFYLPFSTFISACSDGAPIGAINLFAANGETQPSSSKRPNKAPNTITYCSGLSDSMVKFRCLAENKTHKKTQNARNCFLSHCGRTLSKACYR